MRCSDSSDGCEDQLYTAQPIRAHFVKLILVKNNNIHFLCFYLEEKQLVFVVQSSELT